MTTQAPPATSTFCWNELMTGDVEAAKKFYTALFGWETKEMDMGPAVRSWEAFDAIVDALENPLGADINPRPGRHLTEHDQSLGGKLIKMRLRRPMWNKIAVGNDHPRRINSGLTNTHRFT